VYNRYVKERRALKKELIKIKDTEYTNFLLQESENVKAKLKQGGSAYRVNNSIADSQDLEDDSDWITKWLSV